MSIYLIIKAEDLEQAKWWQEELQTGNFQYQLDPVVIDVVDKDLDRELQKITESQL